MNPKPTTNQSMNPAAAEEPGEWMYFPQAMEATGLTERSLRRYMQTKQVRYRKLGKSANARVQLFITDDLNKMRLKDPQEEEIPTFTDIEFDADPESDLEENLQDEDDESWLASDRKRMKLLAEEIMAPLLNTIREQERELHDKDRQLRLLPDLQKQAEEDRKLAELKSLEMIALQKQIEALQASIEVQNENERGEIAKLQARIEELGNLEHVAQDVEAAKAKASELEALIPDLQQQIEKQNEAKAELEAEVCRLKEQATAVSVDETPKKSWWKWFLGVSN